MKEESRLILLIGIRLEDESTLPIFSEIEEAARQAQSIGGSIGSLEVVISEGTQLLLPLGEDLVSSIS